MDVSMDGLRWQLLESYNSLTRKLNDNIKDKSWSPEIIINPGEIQREMETIRSCVITLAYMYDSRENGFKELENPTFEEFNPDNDVIEDN